MSHALGHHARAQGVNKYLLVGLSSRLNVQQPWHRVAISNRCLVAADDDGVAFRRKDYRIDGPDRWKTMRLHPHEFIRRFLLYVLPKGFHGIRHYGLFANANRAANIAKARALLGADPSAADPKQQPDVPPDAPRVVPCPCPRCAPA